MNRALVLLAAALCVAGCKPDPNAPPIYRTDAEYEQAVAQVATLTREPFQAMHEGHPISDREKQDLREARRLIDGLIAYRTDKYGPYILRGLTLRGLGEDDGAVRAFQQGLALAPKNLGPDDVQAVARIHDEMASFYFEHGDYKQAEEHADIAIAMLPTEPSLLTDAAGIKVQLRKTSQASAILDRVLAAHPDYERARNLKKLIKMAGVKG